ncbi:polysaccharide deacetylase family protein [Chloroflexota bacterium]
MRARSVRCEGELKITPVDSNNLKNKKIACLRMDLEQDFGDLLDEPRYEGLNYVDDLVAFLKKKRIPLTCFVQGNLFTTHPDIIKKLSILDIEFELHSHSHPKIKEMDLEFEIQRGKEAYCDFWGKEPRGYSAPLGFINDQTYKLLARYGFKYDSSVSPSFRPSVFNNLGKPLKPYLVNDEILELPISVFSWLIRIPMSLSYIILLGKPYFYLLKNAKLSNLINFNFHLHDLFDLDSAKALPLEKFPPIYRAVFGRIYRKRERNGLLILSQFIDSLRQKGYTFSKLIDIYEAIPQTQEKEK